MGVVEKELGELASERQRVEWLARSLKTLKPDAVRLQQKQDSKQGTLVPERTSSPRSASVIKKGTGSSGSKRHRSAISPIREFGKQMFRSDSGKMAFPTELNAYNQMFPYPTNPRHASFGNMTQPEGHSLGESNLSAHNIASEMQKSRGLPKMQGTSISRRPSHKLVTEFKTYIKEAGSCKGIDFPSLEKNYIHFTLMEGGESDRQFGDQLAIKRKNLRPPGSIFKVASPVIWLPSHSTSNKGRDMDLLSSTSILERCGTVETAGKSALKPKNLNVPVTKGKKKPGKIASDVVSQVPRGEQITLQDAECPELHAHKKSDFNSFKWLLTSSGVDLDNKKDSVLKPELVSVRSKASKLQASCPITDKRTTERQSWSERMKGFLVSCGALLTETNTSKYRRHLEQPSFTTRRDDVGDDGRREAKDLLEIYTLHPTKKNEGLVSSRLPIVANDENRAEKPDRGRGQWDDARNKVRLISGLGTSFGNEKSLGSSRKSTRLRNDDNIDGGKRLLVKMTKFGKSVSGQKKGQKKGHDLLLTMLNKVSTGISKQKQMVKPKSLQAASERKTKAPGGLGRYANALVSLKMKENARLPTTNRAKEGSKRGPKKLRLVEVQNAQDCALIHRSKGENDINSISLMKVLDVKSAHVKSPDNSLQVSRDTEGSPVRRDSNRGIQFVNQEMKASVENWLNTSGGFEFLDRADGDKPDMSETVLKNSVFRNSSDRTSLHSWSVQSAEVGVPEAFASVSVVKGKVTSQDNISPVSCMGVQSGLLPQGFLSEEREGVHARRKANTQEGFHVESSAMDKDTCRNDNFSLCEMNLQPQVLTNFDSDPVDSFIHVFQEYREKSEVKDLIMHGVTAGGKRSSVDSQVAEKLNCFAFNPQKRTSSCGMGTRSSSDADEKLTESEELELALLELVIKIVLRDDLIKNAKSGPATVKEDTSSLATNQRKLQHPHVDQAGQALVLNLVHDVKQLSPTPQPIDSTTSSGRDWPDYTCLAEKQSRSESCEEDGDWPEYLGPDDQAGNVEKEVKSDFPVSKDYSEKIPEPGTCHGPSTMTDPLHAPTTCPPSPLPTNISESNDRESIQFPGLSSLAFSCTPPPQSKKSATYIGDRSSTGVQTNDLSVGQPLNPVYILPLYCLPDGRPLLTPYSMYPQYPVPEGSSHIHPMQIPPAVQCVQSHTTTAAISEGVRGTSVIHPSRMKEVQILNSENESRLMLEIKSSSSRSSDAPLSSPRTPSTPISSPEHEARVTSALAHHRRRQKRPCSSEDASSRKGENEESQTARKPDYQQLPVSKQEPVALARNLHADKGHEEYPRPALTTSTMENQLGGGLVLRSVCAASASTRKELEIRPSVYYDDTEGSELAGSYDGSGSSDVSVYQRMYSGLDVPFGGLIVEGLEKLNRAPTTSVGTETRPQSPGETQHSILALARQADGMHANLGRYSLEGHLMYRERDLTRWSGVAREPGLSFSEGEIDPGGLRSEGECGPIYSSPGFLLQNRLYTEHQYGGDVSEPGEISRVAGQHSVRKKSNSMEPSNLIQSLSEGEIRARILNQAERGDMNTPRTSADQKSSSD